MIPTAATPPASPARSSPHSAPTSGVRPPGSGVDVWSRSCCPESVLMRGAGVVELGVVLAEQVATVIVAVGGADHGVNVLARGLVAVQRDPPLVVEFDEDDRAVHAVVEHAVVADSAHPGESGCRPDAGRPPPSSPRRDRAAC